MAQVNWDDIRFFLMLARWGQLSVAARHLASSHVTVARRIDRLEAALGQRLFERSARGYELTGAGRRLVEAAERMEEGSAGILAGEAAGAGFGGSLRLAVPEGFSSLFVRDMLGPFRAAFPGIALELVTLTQVLSLSRREAELAVTLDPVRHGPYRSDHMADYSLRLYGARDLLAGLPPIRSRDDLPALPFIGYIEEMLFAAGLDYLREVHPAIRPGFKSASIFNQMAAARRGIGLCVLPCYMARRHDDLVPVLAGEVVLRRSYWLTCHADIRQMRRERKVSEFLIGAAGAGDWLS